MGTWEPSLRDFIRQSTLKLCRPTYFETLQTRRRPDGQLCRCLLVQVVICSMLSVIFLVSIWAARVVAASNASLEMFSTAQFPNARCLDGSPFGIYHAPPTPGASPEEQKIWVVLLNGGGLCTHASDCMSRAHTSLGSSASFSKVYDMDSVSLLSSDQRNPFRNVNRVFVPYCSGDMHAGQRTAPGPNNSTWGLYFSGYHNIQATVRYLSTRYKLNTTGNILIWSGGSAGGVGVFSTLDFVAESLPAVRVVGVPVGGFPPEIFWSSTKDSKVPNEDIRTPAFRENNELYNAVLPSACAHALGPARSYMCGVPHIAYPYLQTPVFVIQAKTDVVVSCIFEGMPCKPVAKALFNPENWQRWSTFGQNASVLLANTVMKSERDGLFASSCLIHTGFTLDGPLIDSQNAVEALYSWVFSKENSTAQRSHKHQDICAGNRYYPPCGHKCPPLWKPLNGNLMAI